MTSISLGLHVLFAAIVVGGQVLLYFAVVPASWLIDDERLRGTMTRVVARRFGMLAGVSLVGLLVTGLYQFYNDDLVPQPVQEHMLDYRWGQVFMVKMILFVVLIAMIAVHGIVFGRRIREASDATAAGQAGAAERLERLRRSSLLFSALMVLVSVVLVILGATLSNDSYSLQSS